MNSDFLRCVRRAIIFIACGLATPALSLAKQPTPAPARFESEIAAFEAYDHKNAAPPNSILFVGSSTIRFWQTADAFPDVPIINRGFGGSTIADVNQYADRIVDKYKPRLIVFYAGDNDLAAGLTPGHVFADFQTFVKSTHDHLPGTPIIFLSIKPSPARWKLWPQAQEVNSRIHALTSDDHLLTYIDTAPPLLGSDGQPRKDLYRDDGLHLSPHGYSHWNTLLRPVLESAIKSR